MAQFSTAYKITVAHEGGYSNNPADNGGETWKGIARNKNPQWRGWRIVDELKVVVGYTDRYGRVANPAKKEAAVKAMSESTSLEVAVQEIYKMQYWDIYLLDQMNDQAMANELFDTGVNVGTGIAGTFLQRCLNVLNTDGKGKRLWQELNVDGRVGPTTMAVYNSVGAIRAGAVRKLFNCLQGERYMAIAEKNPTQEIFMLGWLNRVSF